MKIAIPDLISNSYFPAIAAVDLGFFKEEGLDVNLPALPEARSRANPSSSRSQHEKDQDRLSERQRKAQTHGRSKKKPLEKETQCTLEA